MAIFTKKDPVELLDEAFEEYRDYVALMDAAALGMVGPTDEPEFYAPSAVPQGLFVH